MEIVILCVFVQLLLVAWLARRFGVSAFGKIGFLFMASTFFYHGLTEVAQILFPGRNEYRDLTSEGAVRSWVVLITVAMILFTVTYAHRARAFSVPFHRERLLVDLSGAYLIKWPVLLALGLAGFVFVILADKTAETGGYWGTGLTDQFSTLLLVLALATYCITTGGRNTVLVFFLYAILLVTTGQRTMLLSTTLLSMSAIVRYGVRLSRKSVMFTGLAVGLALVAISSSRSSHGRFNNGETFSERLEIIGSSASGQSDTQAILNDFVYRFDGNSYGAIILDKQESGYGVTGLPAIATTFMYMVPSFIYRGKLGLDTSQRNEEEYTDVFYGIPDDIDYVSDFWNLLLAYSGTPGMVIFSVLLGLLVAQVDNWLAKSSTLTAYLSGVSISTIPLLLEGGVAGIPHALRGLAVMLIIARVVSRPGQADRRRQLGGGAPEIVYLSYQPPI